MKFLILPPRLAPAHVVILPITFKADDPQAVMDYCLQLKADLEGTMYDGRPIRVELDARDLRGGEKTWSVSPCSTTCPRYMTTTRSAR